MHNQHNQMENKPQNIGPNIGLVAVKKVINPYAQLKIKSDSSGIDTQNMPFVMNPFDEVAIETAARLKEQGNLESIIAVSIGDDCKDILMQALARGADKAIFIKTEESITPLNIAKILKYIVLEHQINMVFLGKQAIDDDCNQTSQMLAGLLNWPQGCFVSKITFNDNTSDKYFTITAEREIDSGIEALDISLPAVISVDLQPTDTKYISLPQLLQAKKKPIDIILLEHLTKNIPNINLDNIKILKTSLPPQRPTGIKISSTNELITRLKTKDKVI